MDSILAIVPLPIQHELQKRACAIANQELRRIRQALLDERSLRSRAFLNRVGDTSSFLQAIGKLDAIGLEAMGTIRKDCEQLTVRLLTYTSRHDQTH